MKRIHIYLTNKKLSNLLIIFVLYLIKDNIFLILEKLVKQKT